MKINPKKWLKCYLVIQILLIFCIVFSVAFVDPFFHYHKPFTDLFYYSLNNERSQNDGILKHFDYDAIITGTSMTENFKTSEVNQIFGVNSIKVPFSGATYKEINDNVYQGLQRNPDVKMVIRGLDMFFFFYDKDAMRTELGSYPEYLYNNFLFDDTKYLLNKDIFFSRVCNMIEGRIKGGNAGITPFDKYANWMDKYTFGADSVLEGVKSFSEPKTTSSMSDDEKQELHDSIEQNVIKTAQDFPNTEFYLFFPPYSIAWWGGIYSYGELDKYLQAEKEVIEMLLPYENIHLFSFNTHADIIANLDNYKDNAHYGEWINTEMLNYMKQGIGELNEDNYAAYTQQEYDFLSTYDYQSLLSQKNGN